MSDPSASSSSSASSGDGRQPPTADLGDAVADEEQLLAGAPNLTDARARQARPGDDGPTRESQLVAGEIADSLSYGPELGRLNEAVRRQDADEASTAENASSNDGTDR